MRNVNTITTRYNRFNRNTFYEETQFQNLNFEKGLKSINSKELWFINKAQSEKEEVYDYIVNAYIKYLDNDFTFLDDFVGDELLMDYKIERLLDIIKKVQRTRYTKKDLKNIIKFKNRNNPKLHFYIKKSRDNLSIILIDLYHMGIYGDNFVNGKSRIIPMDKIYRKYKENQCDLDKIKELFKSI